MVPVDPIIFSSVSLYRSGCASVGVCVCVCVRFFVCEYINVCAYAWVCLSVLCFCEKKREGERERCACFCAIMLQSKIGVLVSWSSGVCVCVCVCVCVSQTQIYNCVFETAPMNASIPPGERRRFAYALPRFLLLHARVLSIHSWVRLWSFDQDVPLRRVCVCASVYVRACVRACVPECVRARVCVRLRPGRNVSACPATPRLPLR